MSFSEYMIAVPPWLRFVLTIAVSVLITVIAVKAFHPRILRLNQEPPESDDNPDAAPPPGVAGLSGRLIGVSTFAFVFLLAFAFSQFWAADKDARTAVTSEATDYARVVSLASRLSPEISTPLVSALDDYKRSVLEEEWPLMQSADSAALAPVRYAAAARAAEALYAADEAGASKDPVWGELTSTFDSLLSDGLDRSNELPDQNAVAILWVVGILAILNLAFIIMFQPAVLRLNVILAGFLAALTAFLMFVLVEVSNPYVGSASVRPALPSTSTTPTP